MLLRILRGNGLRTVSSKLFARRGLITDIPEVEYHKVADRTFDVLITLLSKAEDATTILDYNYSMGVLNVSIENKGTWVINKQTPNKQIWWSSPVSGPHRFDFEPPYGWSSESNPLDCWNSPKFKGGRTLHDTFVVEMKDSLGIDVASIWTD